VASETTPAACRRSEADPREIGVPWQRRATAWWARLHSDYLSRNYSCSFVSVVARSTNRRTSGTVSGIRPGLGSPTCLMPRESRGLWS
jgi:hypothetical protein